MRSPCQLPSDSALEAQVAWLLPSTPDLTVAYDPPADGTGPEQYDRAQDDLLEDALEMRGWATSELLGAPDF